MAVIELRKKDQVTIPKQIIESMCLHVGDKFEIIQKYGIIYMMPVSIYPKKYVDDLEKIAKEAKVSIKESVTPTFNKVSDLFAHLDNS